MGWTFIMDQDAPMVHAAKIVNRHEKLDKLEAKNKGIEYTKPAIDE